ncbi:Putative membrane protein ydgH [Nocardia otitidiscaviarum]|uniref:Membrane protein ydgH n=1 Tax=Nocardia otitidiscaviarum TaxID=1823 RepID=A0A378YID1_9NOCA|nr:MMPL family transporter [Nocardia otitidiscaviarum]SUA76503.1 Putative membrane protein ydgH [Nocardia otitidiscaviarum]
MFAILGRFVVHKPWVVIGIWLIAIVGVVASAPKLTATTDQAEFLPAHYESVEAMALQEKAFDDSQLPAAIIVVERADEQPLTATDAAAVTALAADLAARNIEHITGVQATPPSENRLVQMIGVQMVKVTAADDTRQTDAVEDLREAVQEVVSGTELKAGVTGSAAAMLDQIESSEKGLAIVGIATILLIIVLLLLIFRSPVLALLPILIIYAISLLVHGAVAWSAEAFEFSIDSSVQALLLVVLFGVGTDYFLFLIFRYRERLRAGDDPQTAMVNAVARVGEAIASAAFAVIIAFAALVLSALGMFRSLGVSLAIAVAIMLVAGLTLIPAIVSLLGTKVFWPSKSWQREPRGAVSAGIGRSLGKHPAVYAVLSGLVLVALGGFAVGFNPTFDLTSGATSDTSESAVWGQELRKGMPAGATQPSLVYLRTHGQDQLTEAQLAQFGTALATVEGVGQVSPPQRSADSTVAEYQVTLTDAPESDTAIDTVRGPLRDTAHAAAPAGTAALVGGMTSVFVDFQDAMVRDYTIVFPVAALLIMLVLALLLRSLVAPWYLMASVFLGFAATLGAAVLVFQHAQGDSGLIFTLPIIMYLFVVALGTDYNILMVARLREEAREGLEPRQAAASAVRHSGPTIAAAGLILAGTFASMMLAGNSVLAQMGFAISVGIAIAAFVMSMFFTPALTALIGHRAWWPGHGDERKVRRNDPDRSIGYDDREHDTASR